MTSDISINVTLKLRIRPYESLHDLVAVVGDKEEVLRRVTLDQWHRVCATFEQHLPAVKTERKPRDIREFVSFTPEMGTLFDAVAHAYHENWKTNGPSKGKDYKHVLSLAHARMLWAAGIRPVGPLWGHFSGVPLIGTFHLSDMPGEEHRKLPSPKTSAPVAKCTVDPLMDELTKITVAMMPSEQAFDAGVLDPQATAERFYSPPEIPVAEATCDECYGTGHRMGFGAPCSRGCGRKS